MKRWIPLLLVAPCLLPFVGCAGVTIYNNFRLNDLERRVARLPHPAGSKKLAQKSECGLLGNGNHCDFFVAELRQNNGKMRVTTAYSGLRLVVPHSQDEPFQDVKNGTQPVEIEVLPSPLPPNFSWEYGNEWNLATFAGQHNLYIIYIKNSGENNSWETLFDWRCT